MAFNVIKFPTAGEPITKSDQGLYFAFNIRTCKVHSIFRLDFEKQWFLHQLEHPSQNKPYAWAILAEHANDTLREVSIQELRSYLTMLQAAAPNGAWQVMRNAHFGFGKFTPHNPEEPIRFALMPFLNDEMQIPVWVLKADDTHVVRAKKIFGKAIQTA